MLSPPPSWAAAVLREPGTDLEIIEIQRTQLLSGQVLVALDYSGVCRSQLMEVRGLRGPDPWLPHLLGHEGVGTVAEIGPDVTKVSVGDRVILGWIKGEGIESASPTFSALNGEKINAGRVTTFSEYTVVSENRVYQKPAAIDDRVAVLLGCAALTGAGMVLNELCPSAGETLLINGLGGVGFWALLSAITIPTTVIAVDPDFDKRALALSLGASHAINPMAGDLVQQVHALYPSGVDAAIDSSGTTKGIEAAFAVVRKHGGNLIFASHPPTGDRIQIEPHDLIEGKTIRGSWGGASRPDRDIPKLARAMSALAVSFQFLVPDVYPLNKVNQALADLEMHRAMRPVLATTDKGLDSGSQSGQTDLRAEHG